MDEIKTMQNNHSATEEKTFNQEDVNRIVSERLAKERAKGEAALAEREQQLAQRELLFTAKEKLNKADLPVELLDALNMPDEQTLEKSIEIIKNVIGAERVSKVFNTGGLGGYSPKGGTSPQPVDIGAEFRKGRKG